MAKVFAAKGYRVFATLRNSSKGGPSLENTPGIEVLLFDVTSLDSIKQCAAEVQKRTGGKLDVLVNNAGADYVMPLLDVDIDDAKRFYDLNVWSVLGMVQAFAPVLIKAKGVVVNHSSVASVMPLAWAGKSLPLRHLQQFQISHEQHIGYPPCRRSACHHCCDQLLSTRPSTQRPAISSCRRVRTISRSLIGSVISGRDWRSWDPWMSTWFPDQWLLILRVEKMV